MMRKLTILLLLFCFLFMTSASAANINLSTCKFGGWVSGNNYILNQSVTAPWDCMAIDANNVSLDCNGFNISGGGLGADGIRIWGVNNVTVRNCNVYGYRHPISLFNSTNITLINNSVYNSLEEGIYLYQTSCITLINNTAINNSEDGIIVWLSNYTTLIGNTALGNNDSGIYLYKTQFVNMSGNNMSGNGANFYLYCEMEFGNCVDGNLDNSIDRTNIEEGRFIYYEKNIANKFYNFSNISSFFCVNCNNVTVRDLDIYDSGTGVVLYKSNNSWIDRINCTNNVNGIVLHGFNNNITNSRITGGSYSGIFSGFGSGYYIFNNTVSNGNQGMWFFNLMNSEIVNNTVDSNNNGFFPGGIYAFNSNFLNFTGNTLINNTFAALQLDGVNFTYIADNYLNDNPYYGINLNLFSSFSLMVNNTATNNGVGVALSASSNVFVVNNSFNNNIAGLLILGINVNVSNNIFDSNTFGIFSNFSINTNLSDNIITNNLDNGISLTRFYNGSLIRNNISGNGNGGATDYGLVIVNSSGNFLMNNTFSNPNAASDLSFDVSCLDNSLIGNTIEPNSVFFNIPQFLGSMTISGVSNPPSTTMKHISKFLDINSSGWVFLNVSYNDSDLGTYNETNLTLFHYVGSNWVEVNGSGVDTVNNYVFGNLTNFSVIGALVKGSFISSPRRRVTGGGSGGGGSATRYLFWEDNETSLFVEKMKPYNPVVKFNFETEPYTINVQSNYRDSLKFRLVTPKGIKYVAADKSSMIEIDLNEDGKNDISLGISTITSYVGTDITFSRIILEKVQPITTRAVQESEPEVVEEELKPKIIEEPKEDLIPIEKKNIAVWLWVLIFLIIFILIFLTIYIIWKKRND